MEQLNQKVISSQDETLFSAQVSGGYGYDETAKKWRRLTCDSEGKQKIEATLELDSSSLAKEATQLLVKANTEVGQGAGNNTRGNIGDGSTQQNVVCLGYDQPNGKMVSLNVNSGGNLAVDVQSGVAIATIGSGGHGSGTGVISCGLDSGANARALKTDSNGELLVNFGSSTTQSVNCLGNEVGDGSGAVKHLHLDGNGNVQADIVNTANVKFEDISSSLNSGTANDPANSLAVGLRARTDIADSATETFLLTDAQGHLQCDIVSGGGGGGSTTYTTESKSVPDNTLTIIGDNTNAYIDTNGGSKFVVSVSSATFTGSPAMNIEWSDNTSFNSGKVFVCNGYIGGSAITTPVSLTSTTRLDGTTLAIQGISAFDLIPARYARITIEQTSGGAITYTAHSVLSP